MHFIAICLLGLVLAITAGLDATPLIDQEYDEDEQRQVSGYAEDNVKVDYTGAQVWRILTDKSKDHGLISQLENNNLVSIWEITWESVDMLVNSKDINDVKQFLKDRRIVSTWEVSRESVVMLVKSNVMNDVKQILNKGGLQYNVTIDDLQKRIDEESVPMEDYNETLANQEHPMTWKKYHILTDIYKFLDYLAEKHPSFVRVQNIGKSFEGRDMKLIRISNGKPGNKAVFIDGGIHAREWISPAAMTYVINQLVESFKTNKADDVKSIDWHILPVLNPDGYEYTKIDRDWRKNRRPNPNSQCVGTDLNRNFDIKWATGPEANQSPCSETYPGTKAFSEPESKSLSDYIKNSNIKFSAYFTYHSFSQIIMYPWSYSHAEIPDREDLDDLARKMAKAIKQAGAGTITGGTDYRVGQSASVMYISSGCSEDWAKSVGIKYTYTVELNDKGEYGFVLPTKYIEPVGKETMASLRIVAAHLKK